MNPASMIQTGPRVSRIAARIASVGVRTPVSAGSLFALDADREASTEASAFPSFRCPRKASRPLAPPRPFAARLFPNEPFASSQSTDYVYRAWKRKSPGPASRRLPQIATASIPSPVASSVRSPVKTVCLDLPNGKERRQRPSHRQIKSHHQPHRLFPALYQIAKPPRANKPAITPAGIPPVR